MFLLLVNGRPISSAHFKLCYAMISREQYMINCNVLGMSFMTSDVNVFVYVTVDHVYLPQLVTHTTIPSLGLLPGMCSITIYVCVVLPYICTYVWCYHI